MAFDFVVLEHAQHEFEEIIHYLSESLGSPHAAKHFVDEFEKQISLICENHDLFGFSRIPELAELGYRSFLINKYVGLYFFRDGRVVVAHIFHQSQDYAKLV